jgi:heat shock protein HtpX
VDHNLSGSIDAGELDALRNQKVTISSSERMMEIFSTHPNMLKRIKALAQLT